MKLQQMSNASTANYNRNGSPSGGEGVTASSENGLPMGAYIAGTQPAVTPVTPATLFTLFTPITLGSSVTALNVTLPYQSFPLFDSPSIIQRLPIIVAKPLNKVRYYTIYSLLKRNGSYEPFNRLFATDDYFVILINKAIKEFTLNTFNAVVIYFYATIRIHSATSLTKQTLTIELPPYSAFVKELQGTIDFINRTHGWSGLIPDQIDN